uniref:Uncharacterized protein n=1 Tax=Caenorhabditis japonica TaxID=281687 RepID=A0A8R1DVW5_CAEJA
MMSFITLNRLQCSPNCSVRFVKSGGQYYDLVVYSLEELNPEIDITLDYFKGFKADIRKYFSRRRTPDGKIFNLYEDAVDFVHCMCNSPKCRNVLYVDQSLNRTEKMTSKIQKLGNLDPKFQFKGCQLVDSPEKVWEIEFSKFKD